MRSSTSVIALPCVRAGLERIVARKSNRHKSAKRPLGRRRYGEEERQERIRETARDAAPEGQEPALATLVRQSGKSRHDGALPGALHEFRPYPEGIALRKADHRHRADRLRSVALQPAPPRACASR